VRERGVVRISKSDLYDLVQLWDAHPHEYAANEGRLIQIQFHQGKTDDIETDSARKSSPWRAAERPEDRPYRTPLVSHRNSGGRPGIRPDRGTPGPGPFGVCGPSHCGRAHRFR